MNFNILETILIIKVSCAADKTETVMDYNERSFAKLNKHLTCIYERNLALSPENLNSITFLFFLKFVSKPA